MALLGLTDLSFETAKKILFYAYRSITLIEYIQTQAREIWQFENVLIEAKSRIKTGSPIQTGDKVICFKPRTSIRGYMAALNTTLELNST